MTPADIDSTRIPRHIAIIMDGNGRWARERGSQRSLGHEAGVDAVHTVIETAAQLGVQYLTLYTFSTENWNRPQTEVDLLLELIVTAIERETQNLIDQNVRLTAIGDLDRLPERSRSSLEGCMSATAHGSGLTVILALSYSSRWEITDAVRHIARSVAAGKLSPDTITDDTITGALSTAGIPDPELLIRTAGDIRISNFLLWQIAYSELYFTPQYWPDFNAQSLYEAIANYQQRERRFGLTSDQIQGSLPVNPHK